jgi:hypothetical protein
MARGVRALTRTDAHGSSVEAEKHGVALGCASVRDGQWAIQDSNL